MLIDVQFESKQWRRYIRWGLARSYIDDGVFVFQIGREAGQDMILEVELPVPEEPPTGLYVQRVHFPSLGVAYRAGNVISDPWLNNVTTSSELPPDYVRRTHHSYKWHRPAARRQWGPPSGYHDGEVRYALYLFEAQLDDVAQCFILFSDPKTSRKGSTVEMVMPMSPGASKIIFPILEWLSDTRIALGDV